MKKLGYDQPKRMTQAEVLDALKSDPATCAIAVISASWFNEMSFAESVITNASSHSDATVRGAAITAIGHLARIHKDYITVERLIKLLEAGAADPDERVRGKVEAALDDIEVFVPMLTSVVNRIRNR